MAGDVIGRLIKKVSMSGTVMIYEILHNNERSIDVLTWRRHVALLGLLLAVH